MQASPPFELGSRHGISVRRSAPEVLARLAQTERKKGCHGGSAPRVQGSTSRLSGQPCDRGLTAREAAEREAGDQGGKVSWAIRLSLSPIVKNLQTGTVCRTASLQNALVPWLLRRNCMLSSYLLVR